MKKKSLLLVLALLFMFSFQTVFAETSSVYTNEADMLNSLGLFK